MKSNLYNGSATVLTIVLGFCSSTSQHCRAQSSPRFEQRYDRFKDYTSLSLELGTVIQGPHHEVALSLHQTFRGEGRNSTVGSTRLRFYSDSDDGWVYLDYRPVTFLVDGERMRFEPDHDGTVGNGYVLGRVDNQARRTMIEANCQNAM